MQRLIGLGVLSAAVLGVEVLQVRIFSVMLWYHLATLVLAVALLGFGAAGTLLAVRPKLGARDPDDTAAGAAVVFALGLVAAFAVMTRIPLDTFMDARVVQIVMIAVYYVALGLPFAAAGVAVAVLFARGHERATGLYFANLVGSAAGGLLPFALLTPLGGETTLFLLAALAAAGGLVLARGRTRRRQAAAAVAALLLAAPAAPYILPVKAAGTKALGYFERLQNECIRAQGVNGCGELKAEWRRWDPVARIDLVSSPLTKLLWHYFDAPHKVLTIDGDAYTYAYSFADAENRVDFTAVPRLGETAYAAGYWARRRPVEKALIVGLGGGIDVMTALHHGVKHIDAVEINAAMLDAVKTVLKGWNGDPYGRPEVHTRHDEGRAFIHHTNELYDHIQLSGVDTWSGAQAGAYVLAENFLYTVEAFGDYLDRLAPGGKVAMIRWQFDPPREMLRLYVVASEALRRRGVTDPWNYIAVVGEKWFASIIVARDGLTQGDLAALKAKIDAPRAAPWAAPTLMYAPGPEMPATYDFYPMDPGAAPRPARNWFREYVIAQKSGPAAEQAFMDAFPDLITPVTDDDPFFFMYYRLSQVFSPYLGEGGSRESMFPVGYVILFASLVQGLVLALSAVLWPLWRFRREGLRVPGAGAATVYFGALGAGFMLIEVGLIQKLVLFVGHPTLSFAVVVGMLLLFAGIGAWVSGRLGWSPVRLVGTACVAAAVLSAVAALGYTPLFRALLGLPLAARIAVAGLAVAPLGFVLGVPFPNGIRALGRSGSPFVAWAWGVNGLTSVVASTACIVIAMIAGFQTAILTGSALYLAAAVAFARGAPRWAAADPTPGNPTPGDA